MFLPTAVLDREAGPVSVFPGLRLPRAVLTAWTGNLGLDDGTPQSVYSLDRSDLTQVTGRGGQPLAQSLAPGATMELPDGGSITFDGVRRWASLQVARNPGTGPALAAAVLALAGLMMSLFVRRRRVWVRASATDDGRTLVEVAGLTRHEGEGREVLAEEVRALTARMRRDRAGEDHVTGADLAGLSNNLLYSAMAVYAIAMYCYTAELAFAGRAGGARPSGVGHGRRARDGRRRREPPDVRRG